MSPLKVLREKELADRVGVSIRTVRRWRADGNGPPYVLLGGRRIGYAESAVAAWLESRSVSSTSAATVRRNQQG